MRFHYKTIATIFLVHVLLSTCVWAQALRIPNGTNISNTIGRTVGITAIEVKYNAPSVRGRAGQIWGTSIVPYGFQVLGFGSNMESPWRAGADESTTISFSTDVTINGEKLAAGEYGFFIAVYEDHCTLIFNKNTDGWGAYFYDKPQDILRVDTKQQKGVEPMRELLAYTFNNQTANSVELALEWENWRIPFTVGVDTKATILKDIQTQLSGAIGFDPPSLQAGAQWCLNNEVNYDQALEWINSVMLPGLGGQRTFTALNIKAGLLEKKGLTTEATQLKAESLDVATSLELHQYGRQLLAQGKVDDSFVIFEKNYTKFNGAWPTNVGMMRVYSAKKEYKKALQYAEKALKQAPDDLNRNALADAVKKLKAGQGI